jgi:uncharacterized protein YkwD
MNKCMLWAVLIVSSLANAATPPDSQAVEFYNQLSNHYFMTADTGEALGIDHGAAGVGWTRTGRSFQVWGSQATAPADARPICRFYSPGANSHFYTQDAAECGWLKSLEASERTLKAATGAALKGWLYEGIAFYIQASSGGTCAPGTQAIERLYNNGYATGAGSNHRFVDDPALADQMAGQSWIVEGVAFCAPPKSVAATDAAQFVVAYVNDLRRSQGLQPVAPDARLTEAARQLAEYMAATGTFSHTADGRQPWDRALQSGYRWCIISENIAYFYGSGFGNAELASRFFEMWKGSPPHLQNMLNPAVVDTGIVIARSASGAYYAVQMFGRSGC